MRYASLARRPLHFRNFTGFTPSEFSELISVVRSEWFHQRRERLDRPDRKRKIGGGPKHKIPELADRLLVYVIYAKLYLPYLVIGYLFGVDQATICRIVAEMAPVLGKKIIIRRSGKRIRSIEELKELFPDLDEIITDATEQEIQRPQTKRERKKHHSGKQKTFTMKTQISTTPNKLIVHVGSSIPGRMHDYRYLRSTEVPDWLQRHPEVRGRFDLGYQGIKKDYPCATIIHGIKRFRGRKRLTRSEKIFNTKCSKRRIVVEHGIARLKKFGILSHIYRNDKERYSTIFQSIVSLTNFRTLVRQAT